MEHVQREDRARPGHRRVPVRGADAVLPGHAWPSCAKLGFKGLITASNWATASPEVFGPLEKLSYTTGDFIDRHGYFECNHKGDNAAWSIRNGHTYSDRSALRFEAPRPDEAPAVRPSGDGPALRPESPR